MILDEPYLLIKITQTNTYHNPPLGVRVDRALLYIRKPFPPILVGWLIVNVNNNKVCEQLTTLNFFYNNKLMLTHKINVNKL